MLASLLLILGLQVLPTPVQITIPANTPFTIGWSSPWDQQMPKFRLWCDGGILKNYFASELTLGAVVPGAAGPPITSPMVPIEAQAPGMTAGDHLCLISAYYDPKLGEAIVESKSDPMKITIGAPLTIGKIPGVPVQFHIVIKTTIGGGP